MPRSALLPLGLMIAAALLAGCSAPEQPQEAAPRATVADAPAVSAPPPPSAVEAARAGRPIALPDAVETRPAAGPISPRSLALRASTVQDAIVRNMGEAAEGIVVDVDKGIVRLSGDVATEAEYQQAHYIARAVDGVIEVDQSQMRVVR